MAVSIQEEDITILIGAQQVSCKVKRSKKRRRTLALMMDPQEGIVAHIPWRTSKAYLQDFINSHHKWILSKVNKLNTLPQYRFVTGEQLAFLGQMLPLVVTEHDKQRSRCVYQDGQLQVAIKSVEDDEQRRKRIYLQIKKWYSGQAQLFLQERLVFWQEKLNIRCGSLRISNPKRQWGCCHANNNISLNWRVMMTSTELVDYLVVHELCHVPHKNHSPRFWKLVSSMIPDYRERRRELQNHAASYFGAGM